ncbi:MAG: cadherin-like domain-containing protein [Acidobacteriota bacterium]|nr:cadherin-like domain-containing protein [Acidobacteriota bacterium]
MGAGGADLTFQVTVDDGYGGAAADTVVVHVQNANDPPLASAARPTVASIWLVTGANPRRRSENGRFVNLLPPFIPTIGS